ncbi:MAG TPA: FMN-binding protein [Steroidobacteraceae bacterium]|jgi:Na+-translocating ferredoxin:NAD+ oxidoreductase RnfG subunit
MTDPRTTLASAVVCVLATAPLHAHAAVYASAEDAQRELFPDATAFEPVALNLSESQLQDVARLAGPQAGHGSLKIWTARQGATVLGHVFVDEVIGREDFITYAVGIQADGKLLPVHVLEYRESHGGEIRNSRWLAQFAGRSSVQQLRFGTDIKNIAGATLSSEHVTAGVRRILAIRQTALVADARSTG